MCALQIVPIIQRWYVTANVSLHIGPVIDRSTIEKHYTSGRSAINKCLSVFHTRGIQGRRVRCGETPSGLPVSCLSVISDLSGRAVLFRDRIVHRTSSESPNRHRVALRIRLSRPTSCKAAAELFCPRVAASQRGHGNADVDLTTWQTVAGSCGFAGSSEAILCPLMKGAASYFEVTIPQLFRSRFETAMAIIIGIPTNRSEKYTDSNRKIFLAIPKLVTIEFLNRQNLLFGWFLICIDKTKIVLYKAWTLDSLYINYTQVLNVCREWQHSVTWKVCSPTVTSHMGSRIHRFRGSGEYLRGWNRRWRIFRASMRMRQSLPWASNVPLHIRYFIPLSPPIFVA